jgi:hypothetical protein
MSSPHLFDASRAARIRTRLGVGHLTQLGFKGADLAGLWNTLLATVMRDPQDAGALMDLSAIAQLLGRAATGLDLQERALALDTVFRSRPVPTEPKVRLLAIAAATDIAGNIPLDFLLVGSDVDLITLHVSADYPVPAMLPDHDVAIVAMGNAEGVTPLLTQLSRTLADWPRPVLNAPDRILQLERDRLFRLLKDMPGLDCPMTGRASRGDLERVGAGVRSLVHDLPDGRFPLIIRPLDSHAGKGLEKVDTPVALLAYLETHADDAFFVSRFVDYAGPDGLFHKYRIVFIDGVPFPVHMAISEQWKIWYYNAHMEQSDDKRRAEAHFMETFDHDFVARHRLALRELAERVGLDYFGIDCAETRDGRLLLFEGETALIVHDMDPPDVYPYKGPQMRKLFAAFVAMLHRRARVNPDKNAPLRPGQPPICPVVPCPMSTTLTQPAHAG